MSQTLTPLHRRAFLLTGAALGLMIAHPALAGESAFANAPQRKISNDQWKRMLPPNSYGVLRQEDTEAPLPRLSSKATRRAWPCFSLPKT